MKTTDGKATESIINLIREALGPDADVERVRAERRVEIDRIRAKMIARDCWAWVGPR